MEQHTQGQEVHWTYYGKNGPSHWGDLDPAYHLAKEGKAQSPINIVTADAVPSTLPKIQYHYTMTDVEVENNGHTIKASLLKPDSNYIVIGDKKYTLLQFHFHTPSENSVNGKFYDIEMHLVHQAADQQLAVVGIFFEMGKENMTLKKMWESLPEKAEESGEVDVELVMPINIADLLSTDLTAYRFKGALTTPPCSEGVLWTVLATADTMSSDQIKHFKMIFSGHDFPDGNRRPVQPLNGRTVYLDH